jgi:hypothetical protein
VRSTPYILVSLWSAEDEATRVSHGFAEALHRRRGAVAFLHGEAPQHAEVAEAAARWPHAAVILVGHGGHALAARRGGDPWIDAGGLARLMPGRRAYAFACSTFVPHPAIFFSTFACGAVDACVQVFAGHEAPIMAPFAEAADVQHRMVEAMFQLIERFVDGEDDERALVNLGRQHATWDLPIELDLPGGGAAEDGAFGWSSSAFLGGFFQSLRVRAKP